MSDNLASKSAFFASKVTENVYWPTRTLAKGESATVLVYAAQHWNATELFLRRGQRYRLSAQGEWLDAGVSFSPSGGEVHGHHISDLARLGAAALGQLERGFNALTHSHANMPLTRRIETAAWLALIGYVANEVVTDAGSSPGETFTIGDGCEFKPGGDGYLYAFANDAWQTYANNHAVCR